MERRSRERRRAAGAQRSRETRLRGIASSVGLGVFDYDCLTGDSYWSPELREIMGIPHVAPASLKQLGELLHPEDRERTLQRMAESQAPRGNGVYEDDYRLVRPDGSVRWVRAMGHTSFAGREEKRHPLGTSGVVMDITEMRRTEEALLRSRETLGLALRAGRSGTFEWDAQTKDFDWSDELLALYGLRREEFGGRYEDWLACLVEEDRQAADEAMQHALVHGEYAIDFRIRRRDDGQTRWMNARGLIHFDSRRTPIRMVGVNIDITGQKETEEALRQQAMLLELAHEPILVWSEEGGIVFWNDGCHRLYGYPREEALGKTCHGLLKTVFPVSLEHFHGELERNSYWEGEIQQTTRDGRLLTESCRMQRFQLDGRYLILEANHDITDRKELEASLRRMNEELECRIRDRTAELVRSKDELEKSNLALSLSNQEIREFSYIAAHDLQTPLRSVASFARLLQQEYQGRLGPQADTWITTIVEGARRMHVLIQDVLTYSRAEPRAENFKPVDLGKLADEVIAAMEDQVKESGAQISRDALPTAPGDSAQLAQVLLHLIENGIKYRGEEPPRIHISAHRGEAEWVISVRDNGIGIAPKHHERIFEIFRRLHSQQAYPGTGIGLSICRRVVHRHGGRIWVESEPGKGSTFHFSLPDASPSKD